jgi:hypothetical protein
MRQLSKFASVFLLIAIALLTFIPAANAFSGFFVAKTEAKLHNSASRVVISHDGDRSVFFMANDFEGDVKDFARIVPIPVIPKREQVRIGSAEVIEKINTFTAPRLAKYEDDPCQSEYISYLTIGISLLAILGCTVLLIRYIFRTTSRFEQLVRFLGIALIIAILVAIVWPSGPPGQTNKAKQSLGEAKTFVEDRFTVGEYDVTILSSEESDSLSAWLRENGYIVPKDAEPMLQSYIQSGMKFFVVRVNLAEFQKQGGKFLHPIVLDYNSPEFMLPIQLGTLNAKDNQPQDLIVNIISPTGYAEVSNYRNVFIPTDAESFQNRVSGLELPESIQTSFNDFYNAMFQKEYEREGRNVVFIEYAGYSALCDPCVTKPLDPETLKAAGAFWGKRAVTPGGVEYEISKITRLHVRYTKDKFSEDLRFRIVPFEEALKKIPSDKLFRRIDGFQGRYVIRSAKNTFCSSGIPYWNLGDKAKENLSRLTS